MNNTHEKTLSSVYLSSRSIDIFSPESFIIMFFVKCCKLERKKMHVPGRYGKLQHSMDSREWGELINIWLTSVAKRGWYKLVRLAQCYMAEDMTGVAGVRRAERWPGPADCRDTTQAVGRRRSTHTEHSAARASAASPQWSSLASAVQLVQCSSSTVELIFSGTHCCQVEL